MRERPFATATLPQFAPRVSNTSARPSAGASTQTSANSVPLSTYVGRSPESGTARSASSRLDSILWHRETEPARSPPRRPSGTPRVCRDTPPPARKAPQGRASRPGRRTARPICGPAHGAHRCRICRAEPRGTAAAAPCSAVRIPPSFLAPPARQTGLITSIAPAPATASAGTGRGGCSTSTGSRRPGGRTAPRRCPPGKAPSARTGPR